MTQNPHGHNDLVNNGSRRSANFINGILSYENQKFSELKNFNPFQKKLLPNPFDETWEHRFFMKVLLLSVLLTGMISFLFYYLVSNNFDIYQHILQLTAIIPLIRTDFFSYVTILIPVTVGLDYYLLKKHVRLGQILFSLPLMFIIMPGILDNLYIFLFHVKVQSRMEIQFVFLDNLKIWQYQFLSTAYSLGGLLSLKYLKKFKYWQFFAFSCFAILMYSSLLIRLGIQTFAYNISDSYYFPMWLGINIVDVSFTDNVPIYLGINFAIIGLFIFLGIRLKDKKDKWWNWRAF
jgi:hypothetical protein